MKLLFVLLSICVVGLLSGYTIEEDQNEVEFAQDSSEEVDQDKEDITPEWEDELDEDEEIEMLSDKGRDEEKIEKDPKAWFFSRRRRRSPPPQRPPPPPSCPSRVYLYNRGNNGCSKRFLTRSMLRIAKIGAYIGGSHTCDNLRKKSDITWTDNENGRWRVSFGAHVNLCFPSGPSIHWKAGSLVERMGMDRQTLFACCNLRKVSGGAFRDDYTRVCCSGYAKGSGIVKTDPDHFGNFIKLLNAGAPYAQAAAKVYG